MKITKLFLVFSFLIFSFKSFSSPEKLDVVFLSPKTVALLKNKVNKLDSIKYSKQIVMIDNCVPMGEGCFHPQLGFVEKKDAVKEDKKKETSVEVKTFNALETDLVECKDGNYFDIYCGKATSTFKKTPVEVWVDYSSSMRDVDYSPTNKNCSRQFFIDEVKEKCGVNKISVNVFNTSKKQIGSSSGACIAYGLNDQDRLIRWIKESTAKHLVVVTDINEMSLKFKNFIDSEGATIHGEKGDFTAKSLMTLSDKIGNICKKF